MYMFQCVEWLPVLRWFSKLSPQFGKGHAKFGVSRWRWFCFLVSAPRFDDLILKAANLSRWKTKKEFIDNLKFSFKKGHQQPYPMNTWVISPTNCKRHHTYLQANPAEALGVWLVTPPTKCVLRWTAQIQWRMVHLPQHLGIIGDRDRDGLKMLHFSGPTPKSPSGEEGNSHSTFGEIWFKIIQDNIQYTRFHGCSVVVPWLITQIITQIKTLEIHDDFGDVWRSERFLHLGS